MRENKDYELIPASGFEENEAAWDVRILTGDFTETVARYGNVAINEQAGMINFNFVVVSSPDESLDENNEELQNTLGLILQDVLERSLQDGSAVIDERT